MSTDLREQLQQTLGSAYTLERELGGGGMSRVFVAEETRLHRKVVVKVLSPELAAGVSAERFEREIQLAASLQQANIVPLLSAGETNGLPYFTMPFVEGESLRVRLGKGPLSVTEVVGVLRDVSRALSYAHERGVVHRDIKPDNVLLSHGTAVVTDFGIAKALSASRTKSGDATLTQLGTSIGTPAYMSPEQAAGETEIDHRADIYAFGCMAYELLAGHPPFHGRTPTRVLAAQMSETPPPVNDLRPDTPVVLGELVMRCLEKDPGSRPQSANDLARTLDNVTSGAGMPSMPAVLLGGRGMLRRALLVYAAAFIGVAVVAKAAIIAIGLPSWVFPGALIVMALGLPVILFTAYVHRATRRALTATPTLTPRGTQPAAAGTMMTIALKASPHLSWRRAAFGGLYALGAFVLLVGAYMVLRMFGIGPEGSLLAAGKLSSRDEVLIADFAVPGSDSSLSTALTQALRSQLEQSTAVSVMPVSSVTAALEESRRPANTRIDLDVAKDIGLRRGVKAIVAADATQLPGGGYLVTTKLVNTRTGDVLASYQETAQDAAGLLGAIDAATRKLRARIGESLKTIQAEAPLEQATTSSLEALRKYAEGVRANDVEGDYLKAVTVLREAIAIDSTFGIAYRKLAVALSNALEPPSLQRAAIERAYQLRDRMSPRERDLAMGVYFNTRPYVDRAKAIEAYSDALRLDPRSYTASGNLGQLAASKRDWEGALRYGRLTAELLPMSSFGYWYVVDALASTGRFAESAAMLDTLARVDSTSSTWVLANVSLLVARQDYDSLRALLRRQVTARDRDARLAAMQNLANVAAVQGRVAEARRWLDSLNAGLHLRTRADSATATLGQAFFAAAYDLDRPGAIAMTDRISSPEYLAGIPLPDRPYLGIAAVYARAGDATRARAMLSRYDAEVRDSALLRQDGATRHGVLGEVALAEHQPDVAIREFRLADVQSDGAPDPCADCLDLDLGRAYDLAGKADSAIAAFDRYVHSPFSGRILTDQYFLGPVVKRLGELYEAKGNRQQAISSYTRFTDLWKNADPLLEPMVSDVRQRIARLSRAEGR